MDANPDWNERAPKPPRGPPMKTAIALGVLAMFVAAALVPLAVAADRGAARGDLDGRREEMKERRENMTEKREEARGAREARHDAFTERWMNHTRRHAILLDLDGVGTSAKDANVTYTLSLDGNGRAKAKIEDGNITKLHGFAQVLGIVKDENGTVVKSDSFRVMYRVYENQTGILHWQLVSTGRGPWHAPKLMLRGTADQAGDAFDLTGSGRAYLRTDDGRIVLKPLEVSGTLTKV